MFRFNEELKVYVWGYTRGAFDAAHAVVDDFRVGRGSQYPLTVLAGDHEPPPRVGP